MGCGCKPSKCNCNTELPVPPEILIVTEDPTCVGSSCATKCTISGWYETLTSFTIPAYGNRASITVCDSTKYIVGKCVGITDDTGRSFVGRVTALLTATTIEVEAYNNSETNPVGTIITGNAKIYPETICPDEITTPGVIACDPMYYITAQVFNMPNEGEQVLVEFTTCANLQPGQLVNINGAGVLMTVSQDPLNNKRWYFTNTGAYGNIAAATPIGAGAFAILTARTGKLVTTNTGVAPVDPYKINFPIFLSPDNSITGTNTALDPLKTATIQRGEIMVRMKLGQVELANNGNPFVVLFDEVDWSDAAGLFTYDPVTGKFEAAVDLILDVKWWVLADRTQGEGPNSFLMHNTTVYAAGDVKAAGSLATGVMPDTSLVDARTAGSGLIKLLAGEFCVVMVGEADSAGSAPGSNAGDAIIEGYDPGVLSGVTVGIGITGIHASVYRTL